MTTEALPLDSIVTYNFDKTTKLYKVTYITKGDELCSDYFNCEDTCEYQHETFYLRCRDLKTQIESGLMPEGFFTLKEDK